MRNDRRGPDGRFSAGYRADGGRHEGILESLVPVDVWETVLDEANELVTLHIEGRRPVRVTRYEAALVQLASDPRVAVRTLTGFIRLTRLAIRMIELAREKERARSIHDADLAILYKSFRPGSRADWMSALNRIMMRRLADVPSADIIACLRVIDKKRFRR